MFHLQPVIYGKAKTRSKICSNLQKAPLQLCNSPEAFDGLVMEFRPENKFDAPVGVLSEYLDADTDFAIHTVDNFIVYVHYCPDKKFRVNNIEHEVKVNVEFVDDEFIICEDDLAKIELAINNSDIETTVENDGIGPYEFWGHTGNDRGFDYLTIETQTDVCVTITAANVVINEDMLKQIWNEIIIERVSTTREVSVGNDRKSIELECCLDAIKFDADNSKGQITLSWKD